MTDFFDIYFVSSNKEELGAECRRGEIRIGTFRELFLCSLSYWTESKYERQWLDTAEQVVGGANGVFMTSITDPLNSNFVRWWAAYREGGSVILQEQICFLQELSEALSVNFPAKALRPRETASDKGEQISEWVVDVSALQAFVRRRRVN